ncbi:MAG: hypothetical protein ABI199_01075 [Bacteroidia bacterium]
MADKNNFFDPENYNTIHVSVGADDTHAPNKKSNDIAAKLLHLLSDPEQKEFRHETLLLLKKNPNALDILMEAIKNKEIKKNKQYLISAVWEAGIDGSKYLSDFVNIAIEHPFLEAMEALTVIEDMCGKMDQKEIAENIKKMEVAISKTSEKERFFLLQTTCDKLKDFSA